MRVGLAVVAVVLLLPIGSGAPAEVARELAFASLATAEVTDLAYYAQDTGNATRFALHAAVLRVTVWRSAYVETTQTPLPALLEATSSRSEYVVHDAQVTLSAGDHAGWLGLRRAASGTLATNGGARIASSLGSRLGEGAGAGAREDAAQPHFVEPREGPHLAPAGFGDLDVAGAFEARFAGLDVEIAARENVTRLETGWSRGDDALTRATWVSLQVERDGALELRGAQGAAAQAASAQVTWTGTARVVDATGATRFADEGAASLGSSVEGILVAGEPAPSSALAPVSADASSLAGIVLVLLALAVGIGGGVAWGRRRADPLRDWDPEDLVALAYESSQAGDHDEARRWIERARARAPESRRLALDEAYIAEVGGDKARSRELLVALARTGDADGAWMLARSMVREGAHASDVEPWVLSALEGRPVLAFELRDDVAMAPLEARPAVARAVRAAIARIDAGE